MEALPLVSVLFVTYNRLETLEPCLRGFLELTNYPRSCLELVCCDDCSRSEVKERILELPFDKFCFADSRGGLGANVNRGLKACAGDLILQIQDDWVCTGDPDYLLSAVEALMNSPQVGMVLLNEHPEKLEVLYFNDVRGGSLRVYRNRPGQKVEHVGESAYSDWPHLKRREFVDRIGLYIEGKPMWVTELDYAQRVHAQCDTFIADFQGVSCFKHIGESMSFNWPWKKRAVAFLKSVPLGGSLLNLWRALKNMISRLRN